MREIKTVRVCVVWRSIKMAMPREEERVKNPKMRWYFTKEELANSPSRREHGVEPDKELSYRQQAANMIQDMGQKLNVNQLCINTAIVYMHRFYCVHSFKTFHRHLLATSALFLAAKNEEQPRKLQYVAQASYACAYKDQPMLDIQSQTYTKLVEDITYYELLLLETLGFEVNVDHPHPHVVKCMQFLKASKDLAQMAYFMAHNSLLLTTFCLEHSPSTVACVCIHLSCRWKGLDIPRSSDGKSWWEYIDPSINRTKLDDLTKEFLMIYDKSPSRLQKKITEPIKLQGSASGPSVSGSSSASRGQGAGHSASDKGKRPAGSLMHPVKHQKPSPYSHSGSSHGSSKPHPSPGDMKNHSRIGHTHQPHPQASRGVKRHHTSADKEAHSKKRVKMEHNSQPPLPPSSHPPRPPLPAGPPPPNSAPHSHPPPPPPPHHHHKPHSKHNSLVPPLPPPLPLSPSPPPPPPPR